MSRSTPRSPHDAAGDGGFESRAVDRGILRRRAFNLRWAEQPDDVIPLTAADPDLPCPPAVRQAIVEYTAAGNFAYGPAAGLPAFREAVADHLQSRRQTPASPAGIQATDSAASALFLVARALLEPGDEVVIFDPVDFLFAASTEAAGGVVRRVPFTRAGGLDLDRLRAAINPRTRIIALCNPHNPFGRIMSPAALAAVAELAERHDLWVLSDEIWADIVYEDPCPSVAALQRAISRRTIIVGGFSKTYGLAGLRIGYIRTDDPALGERIFACSHAEKTAFGAATLSQIAAAAALRHGQPWYRAFIAHLRGVRDHLCDRLDALPGLRCPRPQATYLAFPRIEIPGLSAEQLTERLLRHARVAVVPGAARWFGPGAEGHIRLAFATDRATVDAALARVEAHWDRCITADPAATA